MRQTSENKESEQTPFSRFQSLTKRLVAVPKAEANELKTTEAKDSRKHPKKSAA